MKKPFIIIVYGPTGVGKTDIALHLGEHAPIEIVNMDVGQFYTPFSIGTAKPDWKTSKIPHHLFDIIDTPSSLTVVAYRERLLQLLDAIWSRGNIPVLVGGSSFYLHSLLFVHNDFIDRHAVKPTDYPVTWQELYHIDPDRASQIKENDTYRIERALSLWYTTHKKPTSFIAHYEPPSDFLLLHITRDRTDLYDRINTRVQQMIEQGWIDEVQVLDKSGWSDFIRNKKLIGYNELLDYTKQNNPDSFKRVIELIQQRTRQYAKRQETFWRKIDGEIAQAQMTNMHTIKGCVESVNMTHIDSVVYNKQLTERCIKLIG